MINRMARMRPHLPGIGAVVVLALRTAGDPGGRAESAALGSAGDRIPLPRSRPQPLAAGPNAGPPSKTTAPSSPAAVALSTAVPGSALARAALPPAANLAISPEDLATLKDAITLARNGKTGPVTDLQRNISDPLGRKLIEWVLRRSDNNTSNHSRYAAFISAKPSWPSIGLLRRRAEAMVWQEQAEPASIRAIFAKEQPVSAKGRFALARALLAFGDRTGAQAQLREAWRNEALSSDLEDQVLDTFKDLLTPADHKARMDMPRYVEDVDAGLRAANRAGSTALAIGKAWAAVSRKVPNVKVEELARHS